MANNLFDLIAGIPATQEKINRPIVKLDDLLRLLHKGDRVPAIRAAVAPVVKPIEDARNYLEKRAAPVNKVLSDVYDNTIGLAPLKRWAKGQGMVDRDRFDTSLGGLVNYIMAAQKEPTRPNLTLDTSGIKPSGWTPRQTPPSGDIELIKRRLQGGGLDMAE